MTYSTDEWIRLREEIMASASKEPGYASAALRREYARLSSADRRFVDAWAESAVLSEDETDRFDALDLIRHFRIRDCLPALRELASRLESDPAPGAPYEWARVNTLIAKLEESS